MAQNPAFAPLENPTARRNLRNPSPEADGPICFSDDERRTDEPSTSPPPARPPTPARTNPRGSSPSSDGRNRPDGSEAEPPRLVVARRASSFLAPRFTQGRRERRGGEVFLVLVWIGLVWFGEEGTGGTDDAGWRIGGRERGRRGGNHGGDLLWRFGSVIWSDPAFPGRRGRGGGGGGGGCCHGVV